MTAQCRLPPLVSGCVLGMGVSLGCPDPGASLTIPCSASAWFGRCCHRGHSSLQADGTMALARLQQPQFQLTVPVCPRPAVTPQRCSRGSLPSSAQRDPAPCAGPFWGCRGAQRGEELLKHGGCREGAEPGSVSALSSLPPQRRAPVQCQGCPCTAGPSGT